MPAGAILDLWREALTTVLVVAAPFLISALAVGLVTALLQAATQLQENALSFIPKLVVVGVVMAVAGPWVLARLVHFTQVVAQTAAALGQGGGQ
jgi:flagellar biosynthesis protein FliQ